MPGALSIYAYLTFNGNCRQAMKFYQKCLGGKLTFQTVSKTPEANRLPQQAQKYIVQATLHKDDLILVGSDLVGDEGLLKGNAVCMLLHCKTKTKAKDVYRRLSKNGQPTQPLVKNYFGIVMGGITDQFGYRWILTA